MLLTSWKNGTAESRVAQVTVVRVTCRRLAATRRSLVLNFQCVERRLISHTLTTREVRVNPSPEMAENLSSKWSTKSERRKLK